MEHRDSVKNPDQLLRERTRYRNIISTALVDQDDPLAVYDQFVQWTLTHYSENDTASGLLELLEEATRKFKDDSSYKADLRYFKLWSLYARQVGMTAAISIYALLVASEIGTTYAVLYEEYASLLEQDSRWSEADAIYRKGIKRKVRPLERLKTRYKEFQDRKSLTPSLKPPPTASSSRSSIGPEAEAIRNNPLKNYGQIKSVPTTAPVTSTPNSRYALMLAPPAPGKRPEKLSFNLSLLFTEEGVEYCIAEARARSMGLLNKKWGPPPPSELRSSSSSTLSSVRVAFNDDGQKSTRNLTGMGRRKSLMVGEPTVTINTKEALADVFGMYNSPEKTTRLVGVPGSKHAPVRKVEPVTPGALNVRTHTQDNEIGNQSTKAPQPGFRPFVDENANAARKENTTPAPSKFRPFVDEADSKAPFVTPRPALIPKDSVAPTPSQPAANENRNVLKLKSVPEDANVDVENNVFGKVFTPATLKQQQKSQLQPHRDVFTDVLGQPQPRNTTSHHQRARSSPQLDENVVGATFSPFVDENSSDAKTPFKVFSRPPAQNENVFAPKTPSAFVPFRDGANRAKEAFTPLSNANAVFPPVVPDATSLPRREVEEEHEEEQESDQYQDDYEYDDEHENEEYIHDAPPLSDNISDELEEGESYRQIPLGGRFGQFNVMTPITERTFEFTTSGRVFESTPTSRHKILEGDEAFMIGEFQAVEAAERLASELREVGEGDDEEEEEEESLLRSPKFDHEEARESAIGTKSDSRSLLATLTLSSNFQPPNPCNPFDPPIMTTLLSIIPSDSNYYDLRHLEAKLLDPLRKFAQKARKTSTLDMNASFPMTLSERRFTASEILGEGGFGTVFKARDLGVKDRAADDDDDDDDEDDEDDGSSMVALKVVKPRNVWEYQVLRRLHSTLPPSLRQSIVLPHALYAFRDESFLVMDLCPQGTLLSIVNNAASAGVSQQGACLDELLVMFFTVELLRLLEGMHTAGFIHGDLKIDNCLLRLEDVPGGASAWSSIYQPSGEGGWRHKGVKVIDFGRTIDTSLFPSNQTFIADWPTDDRDCLEMREDRPWTYQTDYFGMAGIIYCMLFRKYIQASSVVPAANVPAGERRFKIATPFKRYWQADIWSRLFDVLLNPTLVRPQGQLPLCEELGVLRKEMEAWLQSNCNRTSNTLKGLLKKIEVSVWRTR